MELSNKEIQTTLKILNPNLSKKNIEQFIDVSTYFERTNKEIELIHNNIFFILKGTVRGYVYTDSGYEKTIFLRTEGFFGGDIKDMFYNKDRTYTFEAIDNAHILLFKLKDLETIALSDQNLMEMYLSFLKDIIYVLNYRVETMITLSAKDRYLDLIKLNPKFLETAYAKHVANFLGITPVSFSRIVKKIKEKK